MEKLELYEKVRSVPMNAQKPIEGGRLKGKTDVNPMWRIKTLTEQFGPCGVGWKAPIKRMWLEAGANGEMAAFCAIDLYVKVDGEWSEPIAGIGGSMFVANEKSGPYTSDECYKMAYTDAISVACKMLGVGADVYWDKDGTKYSKTTKPNEPPKPNAKPKTDYYLQFKELIDNSKGKITKSTIIEKMERKFGIRETSKLNETQFLALLKELTNETQG